MKVADIHIIGHIGDIFIGQLTVSKHWRKIGC